MTEQRSARRLSLASRVFRWILLAVAASVGLAACSQDGEFAAQVGDVSYSVEDLNEYLATPEGNPTADRTEAANWLNFWIYFSLFEQAMADRGVSVTAQHETDALSRMTTGDPTFDPDAAGSDVLVHQQAIVAAVNEWALAQARAEDLDPEELRHLCSRHILVGTPDQVEEVIARLGAGEVFEALALEFSLDESSAAVGGELGCVVEGTFVEPFEQAGYAAEAGELVVAQSSFGFHVIEVHSNGPATPEHHPQLDEAALSEMLHEAFHQVTTLEEARAQLHLEEFVSATEEVVAQEWLDRVKVNERYGYWHPEQMQVVLEAPS